MKMITVSEVRKKYLSFMKDMGHEIINSSKLVPTDDATTLFTSSGMQPLVPYLTGEKHPKGTRISNSQKCFRSGDIEEVGDNRHSTFFEMLGNWSLGDYFKEEQIKMFFTFLTDKKYLGLNPEKLLVTVFEGEKSNNLEMDKESASIWQEVFNSVGIEAKIVHIGSTDEGDKRGIKNGERIFYYDETKNWWSRSGTPDNMPLGEIGGPDTEVFYDFGDKVLRGEFVGKPHPNSESGRFMEIGNSVFIQYKKTKDGFELLNQKNVDFGGGLERLTAASNDEPDIFKLDVFEKCIEVLGGSHLYEKNKLSFRIICDHVRASAFMISDGVLPSNVEQGYLLRRLIRRFVFHMTYMLRIEGKYEEIIESIVGAYRDYYKELNTKEITAVVKEEAEKFTKTLKNGIKEFENMSKGGDISGEDAFLLFSTYGFPIELTVELAGKKNVEVDEVVFKECLKKHRELSRKGGSQKFKGGLSDESDECVRYHTATHLLHRALRDVLGSHVFQKGSNITKERLRFDFSHGEKLTDEEVEKIERAVNDVIEKGLDVTFEDMDKDRAKKEGAIGLFEDEYGDVVRVYKVKDYSMELCGGPHVKNTSELGSFRIIKQESIAKGVRRIKAILE